MAHVLVVDDEPQIGDLLQAMLTPLGHRVSVAWSGSAAVTAVRDGCHPDCLLVDVGLPGEDPVTVAAELHALLPATPLVSMSGQLIAVSLAARLGAAYVVHKPFTLVELLLVLQAATRQGEGTP